jgi:MSHA pilin protein MshA
MTAAHRHLWRKQFRNDQGAKMIVNEQRGFTLIELVVVITILGILAAFAVPKFISLDATARAATINGLAGSVRSAAALARGMSMASQNPNTVTMEGSAVALVNNYPNAGANGILAALNTTATGTDFTITAGANAATGTATWSKIGATTPANCIVRYTPPAAAGATPTIQAVTTGC